MNRHYCTYCGKKRNEDKMFYEWHRLLKKGGWICNEHVSTSVDYFEVMESSRRPVFIELFAGSKEISKTAGEFGYETITVDIVEKFNPDICIDILNLRRKQLPRRVDVIWASVPCTVYSIINLENHWEKICIGHRQYEYQPISSDALAALRILRKTLRLIKKLNPKYFFIENPRGALRHRPEMLMIPYRDTVSYFDYGFPYYKPTDIFHNCKNWKPKPITTAVGKTFPDSVLDLSGNYERSKVPRDLIKEILEAVAF